jgi:hypothetical protein
MDDTNRGAPGYRRAPLSAQKRSFTLSERSPQCGLRRMSYSSKRKEALYHMRKAIVILALSILTGPRKTGHPGL